MINKEIPEQLKLYNDLKANMDTLLSKVDQIPNYKKKYEGFKSLCKDFYNEKKEFSLDKFEKLSNNDKLFNAEYEKLIKLYNDFNKYRREKFIAEFINLKECVTFLRGLKESFEKTKNSIEKTMYFLTEIHKKETEKRKKTTLTDLRDMAKDLDVLNLKFESEDSSTIDDCEKLLQVLNTASPPPFKA